MRTVLCCLLAGILLCVLPGLLFSQEPEPAKTWSGTAVSVPVSGTVAEPAPANPFTRLDRFSRADRKLAREVIADASQALGMRRLEFMREVGAGNETCLAELKTSLVMHDDAPGFDPERFQEILQMILDFIKQLLELFSLFL